MTLLGYLSLRSIFFTDWKCIHENSEPLKIYWPYKHLVQKLTREESR